jgi:ribonuclease HII
MRAKPDYSIEAAQGAPGILIAGVDEVGRGPFAGPVVAAAVILTLDTAHWPLGSRLDDSKRLSRRQRDEIAALLRASDGVWFALGAASVVEIDRLNILQASFLAMRRAVARLPVRPDRLLIDGNKIPPGLPCPAMAVIGGDAKSLSIAAASVLAKVTRDRAMTALARRYPAYGWDHNSGYGTKLHQQGLVSHGVSPHHRRSFAPIAALGG